MRGSDNTLTECGDFVCKVSPSFFIVPLVLHTPNRLRVLIVPAFTWYVSRYLLLALTIPP